MSKNETLSHGHSNDNETRHRMCNGEGTIRFKTANLIEGRVMFNGKNIYVYVKTKASDDEEARDKAIAQARKKLKKAICKAEQTGVVPSIITLEDWMEKCVDEKFARGKLNNKSYGDYKVIINSHITGTQMGKTEIYKITVRELEDFYIKLLSDRKDNRKDKKLLRLSPSTIKKIHALISSSLNDAIRQSIITRNVAEKAKRPYDKKRKTMKVPGLDKLERKRFIIEAKSRRLFSAFLLMLSTGIRVGEALSLRWENVDFEKKTISILYTVQRVRNFDGGAKTHIEVGPPKSLSSFRTIAVPSPVILELEKFRDIQKDEKAKWGDAYEGNGLVFCTQNGRYVEARNLARTYYAIRDNAGIPKDKSLYSLRHSYATMLLEKNVHPKIVSELLGHKDIKTTLNIYTHVFPDIKVRAVQKLDDFFSSVLNTTVEFDSLIE